MHSGVLELVWKPNETNCRANLFEPFKAKQFNDVVEICVIQSKI